MGSAPRGRPHLTLPRLRRGPSFPAGRRGALGWHRLRKNLDDRLGFRLHRPASPRRCRRRRRAGPASRNTISSAATTIRSVIPAERLADAAAAVLRRDGADLALYNFDGPQGYRGLREFVANKVARGRGIDCTADDVLITSGSGQGIDLVNRLLLEPRRHGDPRGIHLWRRADQIARASASTSSARRSTTTASGSTRWRASSPI